MLVLSRHVTDRIRIGDDIIIEVTELRGDIVRIGILAPRDIPVHREEVYQAIQRQKQVVASAEDAS
jgi:carbon storage regulator